MMCTCRMRVCDMLCAIQHTHAFIYWYTCRQHAHIIKHTHIYHAHIIHHTSMHHKHITQHAHTHTTYTHHTTHTRISILVYIHTTYTHHTIHTYTLLCACCMRVWYGVYIVYVCGMYVVCIMCVCVPIC